MLFNKLKSFLCKLIINLQTTTRQLTYTYYLLL